jgi:hypothetical protein
MKTAISEAQQRSRAKYEASEKGKESARARALRYWRTSHGREKMLARLKENRDWLSAVKLERGCADCGYKAHPAALHFDHLPGAGKAFNIGHLSGRSRASLESEIAKCEVVCANCHAIRTDSRRKSPSAPIR